MKIKTKIYYTVEVKISSKWDYLVGPISWNIMKYKTVKKAKRAAAKDKKKLISGGLDNLKYKINKHIEIDKIIKIYEK